MKPVEKFRCGECLDIHDYEDDASECCMPRITTVYVCGECEEDFETMDDAAACCGGDQLFTEDGWRKHIDTLERAGQLRLVE